MKKLGGLVLLVVLISSCNNESKINDKVDSLGAKIDTTANEFWDSTKAKAEKVWDSTKVKAGEVWDSTKAGAKRLKDRVEDKLDKKDTTKKKN